MKVLVALPVALALVLGASRAEPLKQQAEPEDALRAALGAAGIQIDLERGLCSIPANVLVREELLEFLLVGPHGSGHESAFSTEVVPSLLNTALLALGVEQGQNARWASPEAAAPREGDRPANAKLEVSPPTGDGFYLYALWKEAGEVYFFRVEDLLCNLKTGRAMQRHRWVYLGSRFAQLEQGQPEQFVADREQNLINIAFFSEGNTLVTAALEDCVEQTIWIANSWMLPKRAWPIQFVFAREPVESVPEEWIESLVDPSAPGDSEGRSEE